MIVKLALGWGSMPVMLKLVLDRGSRKIRPTISRYNLSIKCLIFLVSEMINAVGARRLGWQFLNVAEGIA